MKITLKNGIVIEGTAQELQVVYKDIEKTPREVQPALRKYHYMYIRCQRCGKRTSAKSRDKKYCAGCRKIVINERSTDYYTKKKPGNGLSVEPLQEN